MDGASTGLQRTWLSQSPALRTQPAAKQTFGVRKTGDT